MKNVYGYIRVSTAKQGEGVSLEVQREAILHYADKYGLNITRWFEEKETAAKLGRPLFTEMMKLLKEGAVSGVIIHKIDRGARNLKDWSDLGTLIDQGVEVHFAHESLDLQARGGRLSADIQAVIAADYIRNLRQETIKGIQGRLKQGLYPFNAPTGYLNCGKGKCKIPDPVQAPLVAKAFELYATLHTLLKKMNELGLKNSLGKPVTLSGLSVILNNTFYIGILKVRGMTYNGVHEPIVNHDLFYKVRSVLRNNGNVKVGKHKFQFSKAVVCKECGYSLIAERQKGIVYYRCHTKSCRTKGVRESFIENSLLRVFRSIDLLPEEKGHLQDLLEDAEQGQSFKYSHLLESIKLQKVKIQQKLDRLTDCYLEDGLDKSTYSQRKEQLLSELKAKEVAQRDLNAKKELVFRKAKYFLELSESLVNSYKMGFLEEKRRFVEIVTSNLSLEGKKLIISMQSPFFELSKRAEIASGAPNQTTSRKNEVEFVQSDMDAPIQPRQPVSKEKLKDLFEQILESVARLPDNHFDMYDI
jgi:DNA invertase Pin-like site-specific DNA recombinase